MKRLIILASIYYSNLNAYESTGYGSKSYGSDSYSSY